MIVAFRSAASPYIKMKFAAPLLQHFFKINNALGTIGLIKTFDSNFENIFFYRNFFFTVPWETLPLWFQAEHFSTFLMFKIPHPPKCSASSSIPFKQNCYHAIILNKTFIQTATTDFLFMTWLEKLNCG